MTANNAIHQSRHPKVPSMSTDPCGLVMASVRLTSVAEYFIALGTSFTLANILKPTLAKQ
jgi:hypothetical protein